MALLENKQALFSWAVFFVRNISIDPKISQAITSKVEDVFSRFNEPTQVHLKLLATSWLIHYYILCSDDPEYYVWCNRQLRYLYQYCLLNTHNIAEVALFEMLSTNLRIQDRLQ